MLGTYLHRVRADRPLRARVWRDSRARDRPAGEHGLREKMFGGRRPFHGKVPSATTRVRQASPELRERQRFPARFSGGRLAPQAS